MCSHIFILAIYWSLLRFDCNYAKEPRQLPPIPYIMTDISRHTNAMMCLHATLVRGTSTLKTKRIASHQTKQTNDVNNCNATSSSKTYIKIGTGRALRPLITPNDTMLPLWIEFSDALSSLPTHGGVVHLLIGK